MNKPRANISRLTEFDAFDRRSVILCLTWLAREYLGDAERKEKSGFVARIRSCEEADSVLATAGMLLRRETETEVEVANSASVPRLMPGIELLGRACSAAKAAAENGKIAASYHLRTTRGVPTEWERLHVQKSISVFKRAAETGRQETHRALTELCDLYPEAVPTDEEDEGKHHGE